MSSDDQVVAWCVGCRRYLEEVISRKRDVVAADAQLHMRATGHAVWIERLDNIGSSKFPARRSYDPSARDDRTEERLRGGTL